MNVILNSDVLLTFVPQFQEECVVVMLEHEYYSKNPSNICIALATLTLTLTHKFNTKIFVGASYSGLYEEDRTYQHV